MSKRPPPHSVSVILASAGTGKTYTLTKRLEHEVRDGRDPAKIIATTFTVMAAEELRVRARKNLIEEGLAEPAIKLLGARIGTVNSVSGELISEFALMMGRSPIHEVIPEESQRSSLFSAAAEAIAAHAGILDRLATQFGYNSTWPRRDWRDDLWDVIDRARLNRIDTDELAECAERSWYSLAALFGEKDQAGTAEALDDALRSALEVVLGDFPDTIDLAKKTNDALDEVRRALDVIRVGDPLPWQVWVRLSKLEPAKKDDQKFIELRDCAAAHSRHPRLRANCETYIRTLFQCAGEAMSRYEIYKAARGLVDFVDQERLALSALEDPKIAASLAERLEVAFVDEFQDTNPLQLALFVALSRIVGSSVWVGDPKQAIYGFRGTDPQLIKAVAPKIVESTTAGVPDTLKRSFRSRPGLVHFVNDAFGPSFKRLGLPEDACAISEVERKDLADQSTPLAIWTLSSKPRSRKPDPEALAHAVATTLNEADKWMVVDDDGIPRPLEPGDIAILCRTNNDCAAIAEALTSFGMRVSTDRKDLLKQPEARLATAAMRWTVDPRDTLAMAEMAHLLHDTNEQPGWFSAVLEDDREARLEALVPFASALREIDSRAIEASPGEFVDAVLSCKGLDDAIRRWGEVETRLHNLEAIRGLARLYEQDRQRVRAPATVGDFVTWLSGQDPDQPRSSARDAVSVLTYHGGKGLEWRFVVLMDLDAERKADAFGLHVESDISPEKVDWADPLKGRWLRFWPWPYGAQANNIPLDDVAARDRYGRAAADWEREERIRLLYVGATRARDYLVLAYPAAATALPWLEELRDSDGRAALDLLGADEPTLQVCNKTHAARRASWSAPDAKPDQRDEQIYRTPDADLVTWPALKITPSREPSSTSVNIGSMIDIGGRIPLHGAPDMAAVGNAVHRFLAADQAEWTLFKRTTAAERLLMRWGASGLDPAQLLTISDRLRQHIQNAWPNAEELREVPIDLRFGDRVMSARIDLVLQRDDQIVIIDHKTFPGAHEQWPEFAQQHAAQIALYADAVCRVTGGRLSGMFLHLPIVGQLLMIEHR